MSAKPAMRLQKLMAQSGLGSRRGLEKRMMAGEILLNGQPAQPGTHVRPGDRIRMGRRSWQVVEGRGQATRVLVYNKPTGEITTRSDPEGRPTVFERLPHLKRSRWVAVGRLDINTSGLLLLTNDGLLANHLMHPASRIDREYLCRIHGHPDESVLHRLRTGVELDDGPAAFSDIVAAEQTESHQWFHVVLLEGRNREVRRLWEVAGFQVSRLKRVRYGPVFLPKGLKTGQFHELTPGELNILYQDTGYRPSESDNLSLRPLRR